jgi:chromosome segregation ATPase
MTANLDAVEKLQYEWRTQIERRIEKLVESIDKHTQVITTLSTQENMDKIALKDMAEKLETASRDIIQLTTQLQTVLHRIEMFATFEDDCKGKFKDVITVTKSLSKSLQTLTTYNTSNKSNVARINVEIDSITKKVEVIEDTIGTFKSTTKGYMFLAKVIAGIVTFSVGVLTIFATYKHLQKM